MIAPTNQICSYTCDSLDTLELKGARSYSYQDLKKATNNFSEECLIGKGGFAEVFKVTKLLNYASGAYNLRCIISCTGYIIFIFLIYGHEIINLVQCENNCLQATVDTGVVVAVKKLHVGQRAKKEFENEVNLISNVRHRNLILQLGWCIDGPELLLVLEYMPHGSLDKFLWGTFIMLTYGYNY